ncbi:hypothetical protein ERJ75_001002200 [Trypanosoma vivax]|nr:hypothetical protein TRVL_03223 [Trypanosoma vivax]KAH8611213.1 hypothetical protein ERJ75_001002200 [Trypanosoma vivax]
MSFVNQPPEVAANLFLQLSENADKLDNVQELVLILQQLFIQLFRTADLSRGSSKPLASSLASTEEEKLLVIRAVCALHTTGIKRHKEFFHDETYHPSAALFIQELLGSLSGDRRNWCQRQQVEGMRACVSVVEAIGYRNARNCLPGIVSACVKYIVRSQNGTDAIVVRSSVIDFLRASLLVALSTDVDDERWLMDTVHHLRCSLRRVFAAKELASAKLAPAIAKAMLRLVVDLLVLPTLQAQAVILLAQELVPAYFVLNNLIYLLEGSACIGAHHLPSAFFEQRDVKDILETQLKLLSGAELLHFSSSLMRDEGTRSILPADAGQFSRVLWRCIRVAGTQMDVESLYAARAHTDHISTIIDEFIRCAAYAVRRLTSGAHALDLFMDECEAVLSDWERYMLHPPVIYVLTRLVLWQFTSPVWTQATLCTSDAPSDTSAEETTVENFILSGSFEQLWGIVAQPHLWNITQDEELCSCRQLQHRHTVAAIILRSLTLTAQMFCQKTQSPEVKRKRALRRLNVLVLYLVLEKAAVPGVVHDAAMHAIEAFSRAGGHLDALHFFLENSGFVVDEASRAVTEVELRNAAANVLRGGITFVQTQLLSAPRRMAVPTLPTGAHRRIAQVVKGGPLQLHLSTGTVVPRVADFVTASITAASDGCRRAIMQEDAVGTRMSVLLLVDCFELSAALNRLVPQLAADEEKECVTTAAEPRVRILQHKVLESLQMLLAYCTRNDSITPYIVQAVIRGLTVFLTTPKAAAWEQNVMDEERQEPHKAPPSFPWETEAEPVLARSHLRTVYKVYLSFMAMLTEPVAAFSVPSASRRRSAVERRTLENVRSTPSVLAVMEGFEALFILAGEFLERRMVEEVLPAALLWYERSMLPRIPTATDEKLKCAVKEFIQGLCGIKPSLAEEVRETCISRLSPSIAGYLIT